MKRSTLAMVGIFLAAVISCAPAQAGTLTFSDEYFINSLATFHSIFGSTTTGYGTAGIYQETNTTIPTVTKLSNGSSVPGEFVQNTAPNALDELALFGWTQSLNNGQQVASVYNANNPLNGTNTYFRYRVGGATTPFTFNGFDLRGSTANANLNFTLDAYLGGLLVDSAILTITGNTFSTITENWVNVDAVVIDSTVALPVSWGSGTLYMDNVEINDSVPEPATLLLLGSSLIALAALSRRWKT